MKLINLRPDDVIVLDLPDGRRVEVCLVDIPSRRRCRLGFTAPREVEIWREEMLPDKSDK